MGVETICNLPGKANLDQVYNPDEGFQIETTADWNYAMEYIDHNSDDFGEGSKWGVPLFTLIKGVTVDVDAEHYFKDYEVKYTGDATLNLIGQNEYKFNPENTIFATGANRPTLQVEGQPEATIVFDADINSELEGKDGTDVTKAIKLVSDAKILVKEGTVVEFEKLINKGEMTIEKDVTTEDEWGNVDNAEITAAVIKRNVSEAVNYGTITVAGQFQANSTFTNALNATFKVNGFLNEMNDNNRGKATFTNLVNNGVLDIEKGGTQKGTYGGAVNVTTLLTNTNVINVNGELVAEDIASTGKITVAEDPYALIKLENGYVTGSVNGVQTGSVILAKADQYEMYEEYYDNWSELNVTGVIETTLNSQEEYVAVLRNFNKYYNSRVKKTALEVLNKITLTAPITLGGNVNAAYKEKFDDIKFYLMDNATMDVTALANEKIGGIYSEGAGNALIAKAAAGNYVNVEVGYMNVAKNANLTINKEVKAILTPAASTMLNVAGSLLNLGWIDTQEATPGNDILAVINGNMVNQGRLSNVSKPRYEGDSYKHVEDILKDLKAGNKYYIGAWDVQKPRAMLLKVAFKDIGSATAAFGEQSTWENSSNQERMTEDQIRSILTSAESKLTSIGDYQVVAKEGGTSGYTYVIYIPESMELENLDVMKNAEFLNAAFDVADGTSGSMPYDYKTWFNVTNLKGGTLDLEYAETHPDSWAYGEANRQGGTVKGDFNNRW